MEHLLWSPQFSSGIPDMDNAHRAMIDQFALLLTAPDDELAAAWSSLTARIESDFRSEETMMEAIDYPGLLAHREQHARVLSAMHHLAPQVERGEYQEARKAIDYFPQWFSLHMSTMDAALAVAFKLTDTLPPVK